MLDLGATNVNNIHWGDSEHLAEKDLSELTKSYLKRHLIARGEDGTGIRSVLLQRLQESLEREMNVKVERNIEAELKHRQIADLEEQGAVYCIGLNHKGQLGLSDLHDRSEFTVIPKTRGLGIVHVASKNDVIFAVTKSKEVYCWGGGGVGPMCVDRKIDRAKFESPQLVKNLEGEDIIHISIGSNHATATSKSGDCYSWGEGRNGCLGNGDSKSQEIPDLVPFFIDKIKVIYTLAGEKHNIALALGSDDDDCSKKSVADDSIATETSRVFSWGHSANGRLGLGSFDSNVKIYIPRQVQFPMRERIRTIACGADHSIAAGAFRVFSWGSGDGGKLGHGDYRDRWEPTEIVTLNGQSVTEISCGTWHSACIVHIPPITEGNGWLYTWGTGLTGQLGQNNVTTSLKPKLVEFFCNKHRILKRIFCGSHHCAVISSDNKLFTWGLNLSRCLGHKNEDKEFPFTNIPGYCSDFGTIVNRIGRGCAQSVALGRGYTIVCTSKYNGASALEAQRLIKHNLARKK